MPTILQLSDPHLLMQPDGRCRGLPALACLQHGWRQALAQLAPMRPDLLLISGDLCHDESWGGYARLRDWLQAELAPLGIPAALLAGNHDHPALMRAALAGRAWLAPAAVPLGSWRLLLLNTHRAASLAGWIEAKQRHWLADQLGSTTAPLLLALHHPPVPIGHAGLDAIALQHADALLALLSHQPQLRGVVFGHVHQHWAGFGPRTAGLPALPLWGCPSCLCQFEAVQPCPLGQPQWPGGRLLELRADGTLTSRLMRWPPLQTA